MGIVSGANLGFESIDRGIGSADTGSRIIQLTCNPFVTGGPGTSCVMGDHTGRYLLYIRRYDAYGPRQICVFDFKQMNNLFLWDDASSGAYTVSADGRYFYHLADTIPGVLCLTRVAFADFSVQSRSIAIDCRLHLIPDTMAVSGDFFHVLLREIDGGICFVRGSLMDGGLSIIHHGGPETAGARLAACGDTLWLTIPDILPAGKEKLRRGADSPSLYRYSGAGAVTRCNTPALSGSPSAGAQTIAVPLAHGGLYLPIADKTIAPELLINECCISADGQYFICDRCEDDAIIVGSVSSGCYRVLNLHGASRGLGWYTRPRLSFSGDRRWVVFGSDKSGIAQAYAAYVPSHFLENLNEGGRQ